MERVVCFFVDFYILKESQKFFFFLAERDLRKHVAFLQQLMPLPTSPSQNPFKDFWYTIYSWCSLASASIQLSSLALLPSSLKRYSFQGFCPALFSLDLFPKPNMTTFHISIPIDSSSFFDTQLNASLQSSSCASFTLLSCQTVHVHRAGISFFFFFSKVYIPKYSLTHSTYEINVSRMNRQMNE